jgi:hypothetical protein
MNKEQKEAKVSTKLLTWKEYVKENDYEHDGIFIIELPNCIQIGEQKMNSLAWLRQGEHITPVWANCDTETNKIEILRPSTIYISENQEIED